MRMLREDEHRPFLIGEVELGLVDLEHRVGRRQRPVGGFAVIDVVVAHLGDGELNHTARLPVRDNVVWFVRGEEAAVVEESGLADETERMWTESGTGRTDAHRAPAGRFRQVIDVAGEHPLLLRGVADTRPELVNPSVHADFMTVARQDRREHVGVKHGAHRRNEERRWHLMPIEKVENTRHCRRRTIFADRQRHRERIRALQQFVVDIERQADGDARSVRPGLGRELPAHPRGGDRLPNLLFARIDGDRVHRGGRLFARRRRLT
jgi:hypothetical protein